MPELRQTFLPFSGTCAQCGRTIERGEPACIDDSSGTTLCAACALNASEAPIFRGVPGGAAQREYLRRREKDRSTTKRRLPFAIGAEVVVVLLAYLFAQLAVALINHVTTARHAALKPPIALSTAHALGVLLAVVAGIATGLRLWGPRQTTGAWRSGAEGERKVAARLAVVEAKGILVLHDRRIPGTRWNVDHIAIGSSGVFVIDSKVAKGRVELRRTGSFLRPGPMQLRVGGRDRSAYLDGMARQVRAVATALAGTPAAGGVPIRPMVVLIGATWGLFARPLAVRHIWVGWPKQLARTVSKPGPLPQPQVVAIYQAIANALPPA